MKYFHNSQPLGAVFIEIKLSLPHVRIFVFNSGWAPKWDGHVTTRKVFNDFERFYLRIVFYFRTSLLYFLTTRYNLSSSKMKPF